MQKIKHTFYCFRLIALPALLISLVLAAMLYQSQEAFRIVPLIYTKIAVTLLLLIYVHYFKSAEFYFFHNLGLSRLRIFAYIIFIDLLLYTCLSIVAILILCMN
jgi:hypothetical protein